MDYQNATRKQRIMVERYIADAREVALRDKLRTPTTKSIEHAESDDSTEKNAHEAMVVQEDPYKSVGFVGQGGYGTVDKVYKVSDPHKVLYARKRLRIVKQPDPASRSLQRRKPETIDPLQEVKILRRINFKHVIRIVEAYSLKGSICIIMSPLASTDLGQFLQHIDTRVGKKWHDARKIMLQWPCCLIRAMDHLHARRIKHRDIKPSNILIQGETILLADFGISKAVPNDETTGTVGSVGPHTFNYSAPEVIGEGNARRGRATDIFSLGCIFLEMCTALLAPPGSRAAFATFRLESSATLAYALNQDAILSWILHLWAHWSLLAREKSADDECASSRLKGHLDREQQIPQRTDSGAMQKAAKRAEQDIALGEDFVFIEKRRVEIDALADEIAANPHSARPSSPLTARPSSPLAARLSSPLAARLSSPLTARLSSSLSALPSTWDAMKRRATTQSSPAAQTGATVPSQTIQIQPKRDAVIEDALPDLAFLMLDPNPRKRITARQLVAMMSSPRLHYLGSINKIGCIKCRVPSHKDEDEMLHSEFKNVEDLKLARDPQHALTMKPAEDWEGVKRE